MKEESNFNQCISWLEIVDKEAAEYYSFHVDKDVVNPIPLIYAISHPFTWAYTEKGHDYWDSLNEQFLEFVTGNYEPANEAEVQIKVSQVKPSHYNNDEAYDVYSFAIKNNLGMLEGNVIKYVSRHDKKNGKEDLLKAIETLERLIREKY